MVQTSADPIDGKGLLSRAGAAVSVGLMRPSEPVAERRRASAAHVRSILDNTLDAVVALDGAGRITFWNPRAEETFGLARETVLGRDLGEAVLAAESAPVLRATLEALAAGGPHRRLELTGRRGSAPFSLELTVAAIPG